MRRILVAGLVAWGALAAWAAAQQPRVSTRVVSRTLRLELTLADDAKVRTSFPLPRFDSRGQFIKYRPEELKKYKGDTPAEQKLPGYKGDFANLKRDDTLQVTLVIPKPDRRDKDKVVWVPGEKLTGTFFEAKGSKTFVLEVTYAQLQSQVNVGNLWTGFQDVNGVKSGTKVPVDPAKARVSLILILKEAEGDPKGK